MTRSWKTTVAGICTIVMATITLLIKPLVDDDPATSPLWGQYMK